jgi:hypothetical protein
MDCEFICVDADEDDPTTVVVEGVEFPGWRISCAKAGDALPFPDGSGRTLRVVSTTPIAYPCGFECCGTEFTHKVRVEEPSSNT